MGEKQHREYSGQPDGRQQRENADGNWSEERIRERALIETAIREADGNVTEAARRLGINRVTLHKILRKTGSLA